MRRSFLVKIGSAVALSACSTQPAQTPTAGPTVEIAAIYPQYEDLPDLLETANTVVRGEVVGSRVTEVEPLKVDSSDPMVNPQAGIPEDELEEVPAHPVTISTIRITESLLGDVAIGSEIEVIQTGGRLNGTTFKELSTTYLQVGQPETLFFLDKSEASNYYTPLNPTQATYIVEDDGDLTADTQFNDLNVDSLVEVEDQIAQTEPDAS